MKFNKYSIFIDLVCILLIGTLVQTILPFNINRIIGFGLFFVVFMMLLSKNSKNNLLVLLLSVISVWGSFLITTDMSTNLSNSIYWLIAVWLIFISKDALFQKKILNAFNEEKKIIYATIIAADVILLVSLFSDSGYKVSFGEKYFVGFTVHQHTLASAACFTMCLILIDLCLDKEKNIKILIRHFIFLLPPIIAVLQSSARTFLIPSFIVIVYIFLYKIDNRSIKILVLPIAVVVLKVLLMNSNVFERMIGVTGSNSDTYTSGRTVFWMADIRAFMQSDIINKIFGHGFEYVQKINLKVTNSAIGAHNDYITLLLGVGIFGLLVYIAVLIGEIKNICTLKSIVKKIMLIVFLILPSIINGFYGYQLLLYSYIFFKSIVLKESTDFEGENNCTNIKTERN